MNIFTQSKEWQNFQEKEGRKTWLIEKGGLSGLVIKYDLPFGKSYLYAPSFFISNETDFKNFLTEIKEIAIKENAIFFRCDSKIDLELEKYGFKKAPADYCESATAMPISEAILNVSKNEDEIFKNFKEKTRYNIRLAEKKGVVVKQENNLEEFYRLVGLTAKKEKIGIHPIGHYKNLLDVFQENISIFFAEYEKRNVAAIMILYYGDTAYYLHGGSDYNYRNLMAPHLLHWTVIKETKKRNFSVYNFGGASLDENSPWQGVTRFKLGFGAEIISYPVAYDLIFQSIWYGIYNISRKFIKSIKKF